MRIFFSFVQNLGGVVELETPVSKTDSQSRSKKKASERLKLTS